MRKIGFLVLLPLNAGGMAYAETQPLPDAPGTEINRAPPTATPALSPKVSAIPGPISVDVQARGYEVDARAVRIAVARELALAVKADPQGAQTTVKIHVVHQQDLVVSLSRQGGPEMLRVVKAPGRGDEVPELVALLIGNMARDEAQTLLVDLQTKPAEAPVVQSEKQPEAERPKPAPPEPSPLPHKTVNLSVFHPLATTSDSEHHEFTFEAGLFYGRVGALNGLALSLSGVTRVDGDSHGIQFADLGNINFGGGAGLRIGGLFNYSQEGFDGFQLAGLFNSRGPGVGAELSGLVADGHGKLAGVQVSGLVSLRRGSLSGAQISGVTNIATKDVSGVQLSGLVNVAGEAVNGVQLGLVNVGGHVSGLQLGLINIAEQVDGASLGFITYSKQGKVQWVTWASSTQMLTTGVRFYTGPLYAMPTFGYQPRASGDDVFSPGFSLGARLPLGRFYTDLDVNYSNPAPNFRFDEHLIDLRYRGLAGFEITPWLGVFAGLGAKQRVVTQGTEENTVDLDVSGGIEFF